MLVGNLPKLSIFLGAGGVGKTTVSAAYAISMAKTGKKVGLLSIDPARRLQGALKIDELSDEGINIEIPNCSGALTAATLLPYKTLERWIKNEKLRPDLETKILSHVFYHALAKRFATSSDLIAGARLAEWLETQPDLDELVVDTAPGMHAIEFLVKPEKIIKLFDGKLIGWLKWLLAEDSSSGIIQSVMKSGARKILDGLSQVGGKTFVRDFAEFFILLEEVITTLIKRVQIAGIWLNHPSTNINIVVGVRDDSIFVARELCKILLSINIKPKKIVLNRCFPFNLKNDPGFNKLINNTEFVNNSEKSSINWLNFLKEYSLSQERINLHLQEFGKDIYELPLIQNLNSSENLRINDLAELGNYLIK